MNCELKSLAALAKDTICKKNPFPALKGFSEQEYVCKWGLTDLYEDCENILRAAIDGRKTFDTGWCECRKEPRSLRIISDGNVMTIQTSAEMDEFDNLICDLADPNHELTDEQIDTLYDYWNDNPDMDTETFSEVTIPIGTYEQAMSAIEKMEAENEKELDRIAELVKSWIDEVISLP